MTQPHDFPEAKYVQWAKTHNSPSHPSQDKITALAESYRRRQFDLVAEQTKALIGSFPASFHLWNIAGMVFLQLRQLTEAADAFQRVAALQPQSPQALNSLGVVFHKQQKLEYAVACFEKALIFDPSNAGIQYNLGNALRDNRAFGPALSAYRAAIAMSPDFAPAHNNCGNVLQELGQFEDAIASYQSAVSLNANDTDAQYNMARAFKRIGDPEGVIAAAQSVIEHKPEHADARVHLANALKALGRQDDAIGVYAQALGLNAGSRGRISALRNLLVMPFGSLPAPILGQIDGMVSALNTQEIPASQSLFIKANLQAHKGEIRKAADLYVLANRAKRAEQSGAAPAPVTWDDMKTVDFQFNADRTAPGKNGLSLLLILGSSCSGKSTLESLLARNPDVLPKYEALDHELLSQMSPSFLQSLDHEDRIRLARKAFYLSHPKNDGIAKRLIISTNPNSVFFVHTLVGLLENLHVVWLDRDEPSLIADIFKTDYVSGHAYSNDIASIQQYLTSYKEHMIRISKAIPDRFLTITYSDLLSSPQSQVDRVAELIRRDLAKVSDFDPAQIQYHRTQCAALARYLM